MNKNSLKNLYIMIRCTKKSHKNCLDIRNALFKSSKNILQAYTTNSTFENERICNICKAVILEKDINAFETKLKNVTTKRHGIDKMIMLTSM